MLYYYINRCYNIIILLLWEMKGLLYYYRIGKYKIWVIFVIIYIL